MWSQEFLLKIMKLPLYRHQIFYRENYRGAGEDRPGPAPGMNN